MNRQICRATGTICVTGDGWGRAFGPGAIVDLDDAVAPQLQATWGEVLGPLVALFEPEPSTDAGHVVDFGSVTPVVLHGLSAVTE